MIAVHCLNINHFFFYLITNDILMGQSPDIECVIINTAIIGVISTV